MSPLFERFSSQENLKLAYKYVQNELAHSTLSVNPLNHPATTAIEALGDQFFVALEKCLRDGKYTPERGFFVYIPKDNLGLRPVCVTSMTDRIVFQAMFNPDILGHKIDGQLSDKFCFTNRVTEDEKSNSFLSPYVNGWDKFCDTQIKAFNKGYRWKAEFDVQQYYEHIPIKKLIQKLKEDFGIKDEKILTILERQLCTWAEYPDLPKGIPQGPEPSAVLGNVYLASLDKFAEDELIGTEIQYLRYADDIILMGKNKQAIIHATEKIVKFLREHNLNLNEKTHLSELTDTVEIEARRIIAEYDADSPDIPEDYFSRIVDKVPHTIQTIFEGKSVEKQDLRELKYYLKNGQNYSRKFLESLIKIIPFRPSLTIPIVRYVAEGREDMKFFLKRTDVFFLDNKIWKVYSTPEISEWSKFWLLKLLITSEGNLEEVMDEEMERLMASDKPTIFRMVGFYYQALRGKNVDLDAVKEAIKLSTNDVEKAVYSFFLLDSLPSARVAVQRDCILKTLDANSNELNLIGSYLYRGNPKVKIDEVDGPFSTYLLKKNIPKRMRSGSTPSPALHQPEYYIVPRGALTPFTAPAQAILGLNRKKSKGTDLVFPEPVKWEKVTIKMKKELQDAEIFYNDKLVKSASYVELGFFSGNKQQKPNRQWHFLSALSVLAGTKITEATPYNMMGMIAIGAGCTISRGAVYKIKENLAKKLRELFKTDEDPFVDGEGYYHPKFTLLPESDLRNPEVWAQGGEFVENMSEEEEDDE